MHVNQILTHTNPDLDAMMSVLLLRTFGEEQFPGVREATVTFTSAGTLPDGKTIAQLEKEGTLAVDIGGGRFDTHPTDTKQNQAKKDRAATDLVAETLGVLQHPEWKDLIEYSRLHDTTGHSLTSTQYWHHLISIHSMLLGLQHVYLEHSTKKLEQGIKILENIPYYVKHREDLFEYLPWLIEQINAYLDAEGVDREKPAKHYRTFLKWFKQLQTEPEKAFSSNPLDEIVSLKAILIGAYYRTNNDPSVIKSVLKICLDALLSREKYWFEALKIFDKTAISRRIGKIQIVTVEAENGMVIKAARYRRKPDLIIYRNPKTGAVTIMLQRKGRLSQYPFRKLAAHIRIAECIEKGQKVDYAEVEGLGKQQGWFLHQSETLLIKGSLKAVDFVPTLIPLERLNYVIYFLFDSNWGLKLPSTYVAAFLAYRNPLFRKE